MTLHFVIGITYYVVVTNYSFVFVCGRLRSSGIRLKFVTNTTKEPLRLVHEKLVNLGFDINREEIFTSLTVARRIVEARGYRPFLLMEESAKEDFEGSYLHMIY